MKSWRTARIRQRSIWASAIRRASSWSCGPASGPAIWRASVAAGSDSAGSEKMGRLRPWRSAFRADRAFPSAVLGPVLKRTLVRSGLPLRAVVTGLAHSSVFDDWRLLLQLLGGLAHFSMPLQLT